MPIINITSGQSGIGAALDNNPTWAGRIDPVPQGAARGNNDLLRALLLLTN